MSNLATYIPARLVEAKQCWYLKYYQTNPETGIREPFRRTHDINRIKDIGLRRKRALEIVDEINKKLPAGYPFVNNTSVVESPAILKLKFTGILKAIDFGLSLKLSEFDNEDSWKGYNSKVRILKEWIVSESHSDLKIKDFSKFHARLFLNYLLQKRKLVAVTYNSYIVHLRQVFQILVDQFYVSENVFDGHRQLKEKPTKIRLRFKENTRKRFIEILKANDETWLLLAIVLQYYCFVRPKQLRLMKVSDIDFQKWSVEPPVTTNKTAKEINLIVPEVARSYFPDLLRTCDQSLFLFSNLNNGPGLTKIGKSVMYRRHEKYLKQLKKEGYNIEGLTFYSWKDTGGHDMTYENSDISIFDVQDRMNHSNPNTTKRYVASVDNSAAFIRNEL